MTGQPHALADAPAPDPAQLVEGAPPRRGPRTLWFVLGGVALFALLAPIAIVVGAQTVASAQRSVDAAADFDARLQVYLTHWAETEVAPVTAAQLGGAYDDAYAFNNQAASDSRYGDEDDTFAEPCAATRQNRGSVAAWAADPPRALDGDGDTRVPAYAAAARAEQAITPAVAAVQAAYEHALDVATTLSRYCAATEHVFGAFGSRNGAVDATATTALIGRGEEETLDIGDWTWTATCSYDSCVKTWDAASRTAFADASQAATEEYIAPLADYYAQNCPESALESWCAGQGEWFRQAVALERSRDDVLRTEPLGSEGPTEPYPLTGPAFDALDAQDADAASRAALVALDPGVVSDTALGWDTRFFERRITALEAELGTAITALQDAIAQLPPAAA
ncbi:hypothetical protein HQQ81_02635 [Microbacteriaceae bacterium VKM Ac-2854]|nr:hypothetical protein [Microbacteriaceae bacterium VKM Ac-2854]